MKALTVKQKAFADAYQGEANGNGTLACKIAGYKGSSATLGVVAGENLKKPLVMKYIESIAKNDPLIASRDDRQRFLTRVMQGVEKDIGSRGEPVELSIAVRLKALELLGKTQGDYTQRHDMNLTAKTSGVVIYRLPENGRG